MVGIIPSTWTKHSFDQKISAKLCIKSLYPRHPPFREKEGNTPPSSIQKNNKTEYTQESISTWSDNLHKWRLFMCENSKFSTKQSGSMYTEDSLLQLSSSTDRENRGEASHLPHVNAWKHITVHGICSPYSTLFLTAGINERTIYASWNPVRTRRGPFNQCNLYKCYLTKSSLIQWTCFSSTLLLNFNHYLGRNHYFGHRPACAMM